MLCSAWPFPGQTRRNGQQGKKGKWPCNLRKGGTSDPQSNDSNPSEQCRCSHGYPGRRDERDKRDRQVEFRLYEAEEEVSQEKGVPLSPLIDSPCLH